MRRSIQFLRQHRNWLFTSAVVMSLLLTNACQGGLGMRPGGKVVNADLIPLAEQGQQSGSWMTRDVAVDYQYVRDGSRLRLSGKVRYSDIIVFNFSYIDYFHLDAIFADAQGNVLDMQGVASSAKTDPRDPEYFDVQLVVPSNATAMTFSFRGQGVEGGGNGNGSTGYFWKYPIR